jgi:hypothetical protein
MLRKIDHGFGDVYTIVEFKEAVEQGYINNWDGSGYLIKPDGLHYDTVNQIDCRNLDNLPEGSQIIWFNK